MEILDALYEVIAERQTTPEEGSYTSYLFEKGLDKILKKCGEECAEVLISAKNNDNPGTVEEICDLLYHLLVLMRAQGITPSEVYDVLEQRRQKIGNKKTAHIVEKM